MTILYLGLKVPDHLQLQQLNIIHYPIIRIVPKDPHSPDILKALAEFSSYTHCLFTSQSAVSVLCKDLGIGAAINKKICLAVGHATAQSLATHGARHILVAKEETAEGVIYTLQKMDLRGAFLFWPHSAKSREVLSDYLSAEKIHHCACAIYDTITQQPGPLPDLSTISEIVFTSPSTVGAFLSLFGRPAPHIKLSSIGPVTKAYADTLMKS